MALPSGRVEGPVVRRHRVIDVLRTGSTGPVGWFEFVLQHAQKTCPDQALTEQDSPGSAGIHRQDTTDISHGFLCCSVVIDGLEKQCCAGREWRPVCASVWFPDQELGIHTRQGELTHAAPLSLHARAEHTWRQRRPPSNALVMPGPGSSDECCM